MLPQMMPLPWMGVFFIVLMCFFAVSLIISVNHLSFSVICEKKMKSSSLSMPW